jgi:transcriptional regulator GlxA family with amidase domain
MTMEPVRSRRVLIAAFDGVNLLDLSGPMQAFAVCGPVPSPVGGEEGYEVTAVSAEGGMVTTSTGLAIHTLPLAEVDPGAIDTLIVPGGSPDGVPAQPPELVSWVKRTAPGVRRVCSVCSGAFILAAAGLLDGRRATTHWHWADRLQQEYPWVRVLPDPIFVHDGPIWTSAGITAGIDMSLALIEEDFGHAEAIKTARRLVMFIKRPGGQAQFSAPLIFQSLSDSRFSDLNAWIRQNLSGDLRVDRLAARAGMSERAFTRAYTAQVGHTPAKAVEAMRLEAACGLLESTEIPLKRVASASGFGKEQNLRRVFVRRLGVGPADYRKRFAA